MATGGNSSSRRHLYEQLGAPVLLYRHAPSYDDNSNYTRKAGPWEARTRPADRESRAKVIRSRIEAKTKHLQQMNRAKMRHHSGLPMQLAKRYDETSGNNQQPSQPLPYSEFVTRRRRREQAFPEYCAPLPPADVVTWGLTDEDNVDGNSSRKRRMKYYGLAANDEDGEADEELVVPSVCRSVPPSPADFGNCLLVLPCNCRSCRQSSMRRSWFVIHPTGNRLDAISASRIVLPRQQSVGSDKEQHNNDNGSNSNQLLLGEQVLQVTICGANKGWGSDDKERRLLVVRTRSRCITIACSWVDDTDTGDGNGPSTTNGCCGGVYSLKKVSDTDFCASTFEAQLQPVEDNLQMYTPIYVASNPNATGTKTAPATLAILSHSKPSSSSEQGILSASAKPEQNIIYHTVQHVGSSLKPSIKQYTISKLRHISQIEFTRLHPMVLWASARSSTIHKPGKYHKAITTAHKRPLSGRGTNLYTIDLRSSEPALVFNPSHSERMVDGLHSISSILPDCNQIHRVYVQSISAGSKVWEVDDRMPGRSVCCWTLPGLCDDWGFTGRLGGLHGWGSILARPSVADGSNSRLRSSQQCQHNDLPLLGVSKSFDVGRFGMYQRPEVYPRFSTQTLECSASDMNAGNAGFAVSSSLALPDVGDKVFNCGLAAFRTDIDGLLGKEDMQDIYGNRAGVKDALCVLSMTNRGDLYGHALVDLDPSVQRAARSFEGLPVGCSAVPVPSAAAAAASNKMPGARQNNIVWELQNTFPTQSGAIMPRIITSRDNVRPFFDFDRSYIPSSIDERLPPTARKGKRKSKPRVQKKDAGRSKDITGFPQTQYELHKAKDDQDTKSEDSSSPERSLLVPENMSTTIKYGVDKDAISRYADSFVSLQPTNTSAHAKGQEFAIDSTHASVLINESSCKVVVANDTQQHERKDEEANDEDEPMDLTLSSFNKFQDEWDGAGTARG